MASKRISKKLLAMFAVIPSFLVALPVHAQIPTAAPSLTEQVHAMAAHQREFRNLIEESRDASIRSTALQAAMRDPDPSIKQMALAAFLNSFHSLTPDVDLPNGSPLAQEDVPPLGMSGIVWDAGKVSFTASYLLPISAGCPNSVGSVHGQVAGGRLSLSYDSVCFRRELVATKPLPNTLSPGTMVACQVTMTPDKEGDMLEGVLHCSGVPAGLPVKLPIGA